MNPRNSFTKGFRGRTGEKRERTQNGIWGHFLIILIVRGHDYRPIALVRPSPPLAGVAPPATLKRIYLYTSRKYTPFFPYLGCLLCNLSYVQYLLGLPWLELPGQNLNRTLCPVCKFLNCHSKGHFHQET